MKSLRLPKRHFSVDSTGETQKIKVREFVARQMGENPRILDAFCGTGHLHKIAWNSTENYVGLDKKPFDDNRKTFVCNNEKWVKENDLTSFDIFDIDAYGEPFAVLWNICNQKLAKDKLGIVLTDGMARSTQSSTRRVDVLKTMGLCPHLRSGLQWRERRGFFFKMLLACAEKAGYKPLKYLLFERKNKSHMIYFGTVWEKISN